ncbi:MAG TPA: rhomboid family intramembrane serine protease [bacterium]|nr:rhomboid family intramembrane serine protease [bacterium]
MFTCPSDHAPLTRAKSPYGVVWDCPKCGGRAVGVGVARRVLRSDVVTALWVAGRAADRTRSRTCPACGQLMAEVRAPVNGPTPAVDVCPRCHLLWFDAAELEALPAPPAPPPEPELPEAAREILAAAAAEHIAASSRPPVAVGSEPPEEMWKILPALLGMPVEYETSPLSRLPWATWLVAALAAGVSLAAFGQLDAAVSEWALLPTAPWRHGGATLLTSFLLHGSLFHLLSNMYFLLVFGDNVEDAMGKGAYLLLLLAAALAGDALHIAFDPRSEVPVVGASGGISGIILYYALRFPRARLGLLLRIFLYFRWVNVPAYAYVGFWLLLQAILAGQQLAGLTNVSALAHLGGAAAGVAGWLLTRRR